MSKLACINKTLCALQTHFDDRFWSNIEEVIMAVSFMTVSSSESKSTVVQNMKSWHWDILEICINYIRLKRKACSTVIISLTLWGPELQKLNKWYCQQVGALNRHRSLYHHLTITSSSRRRGKWKGMESRWSWPAIPFAKLRYQEPLRTRKSGRRPASGERPTMRKASILLQTTEDVAGTYRCFSLFPSPILPLVYI